MRRRRSQGRVTPSLRDLLDLQLQIVDDGLDLWAPGAQICGRRFQQRDAIRGLREHVINADGFEGREADVDVVVPPVECGFQIGDEHGDVCIGELGVVRLEDGGHRLEVRHTLVDLRHARCV